MNLACASKLRHTACMDGQELILAGTELLARPSGALWWPAERLLCVADMHLAKSDRIARGGGALLPPYETVETLNRLASEIGALNPKQVICLGDSFDDSTGPDTLGKSERQMLTALIAGCEWSWIVGNHDPVPLGLPGTYRQDFRLGSLVFRHEAVVQVDPGEISGHFHPRISLNIGGRRLTRRCFLSDLHRLILPAFGAYTGGLDCDDPAVAGLFGSGAVAVLTGSPCVRVPVIARGRRSRSG